MFRLRDLDQRDYLSVVDAFSQSNPQSCRGLILDLDGNHVANLPKITSGQVNWASNGAGQGGKSASLVIPDLAGKLGKQLRGREALYQSKVFQQVLHPTLGWVDVPVITGRLDTVPSDGSSVTITLRGKGALLAHSFGAPRRYAKGRKKTDVIKDVATRWGGEASSNLRIIDKPEVLAHDVTYKATDSMWLEMVSLAHSMDLILFYDADGILVGKPHPTKSSKTFRAGPGGWLLSPVQRTPNSLHIVNRVVVHYGPKGAHFVTANLPPQNPYSAHRQRRGGVPQIYTHPITNPHITKQTVAQALANNTLRRLNLDTVAVTAQIFAFPFLEGFDVYRFEDDQTSMTATVTSGSMGLGASGQPMALGYRSQWLSGWAA